MRQRRRAGEAGKPLSILTALLLAACAHARPQALESLTPAPPDALRIMLIDIGQADATLVVFRGKVLLIDAGVAQGGHEEGAHHIAQRLEELTGKRHVDVFVASHFHTDHLGSMSARKSKHEVTGLFALIEREGVTVDTMLDRGSWSLSKPPRVMETYENAVTTWLRTGQVKERKVAHAGDHVALAPELDTMVVGASGSGQLDRLRALFPNWVDSYPPSENDYSIELKVTLGNFEFVTGGDLSGRNLLREFGPNRLSYNDMESPLAATIGAVEIYHVHHHGSANSSNGCFVQVLAPQVSVISSGKNSYGHPDPQIYERLKMYGDVYIAGGADEKVRAMMVPDIVSGDIDIVVAPNGASFKVNGQQYTSRSEAEEHASPDYRAGCGDTLGQEHKLESGESSSD
jgi:beta-lactamase superfamily II metal-dependent hydrolase